MPDTILFDLDGTLLPILEEEFVSCYFEKLALKTAHLGYEKDVLMHALWAGTKDMMKNCGTKTNKEVFWEKFRALLGENLEQIEAAIDSFYTGEFDEVRQVMRESRDCGPMIADLRDKGYTVVLATNPLFPASAVNTRLGWIGLHSELFDHITTYENSCCTKPNPEYYRSVLSAVGKAPEQCLMLGNSVPDDGAAAKLGIRTVFIYDYLEKGTTADIADMEHMSFIEAQRWLTSLPSLV